SDRRARSRPRPSPRACAAAADAVPSRRARGHPAGVEGGRSQSLTLSAAGARSARPRAGTACAPSPVWCRKTHTLLPVTSARPPGTSGGIAMAERWQNEPWTEDMWWSGKTTRRRFLGLSATAASALGATIVVPAPSREACGQAKPYKIGVLQPLTGAAAAGGTTSLVGTQMAAERINKAGGINGRPIELVIADYESKPDVGRRKAEKLVVEDKVDVGEGGYLSNVCLACMPVFEEQETVWMIGVCLDTTITTSKCS